MQSKCVIGDPPGHFLDGLPTKSVYLTVNPLFLIRCFAIRMNEYQFVIVTQILSNMEPITVHFWSVNLSHERQKWDQTSSPTSSKELPLLSSQRKP